MRKILALILAVCIVFQLVAFAGYEETEAVKYENKYEYLEFLDTLGFSELRYDENAPLTRLDFAKALALILGFDIEKDIYTENPFSDVNYYDNGGYEIAFLKEKGILKGSADGVFDKNSNITLVQASVMLVRAVGYNLVFESAGTEVTESFRIANSLDITKGVKENSDGTVNYSELKKMFFNTLIAQSLEIDSVKFNNASQPEYTYKKTGKSFSEELYGIRPVTGVVTKNDIADLSEIGTVSNNGYVVINGENFNDKEFLSREFTGQRVIAFADSDDNIKYIYPYKNKFTEIDFELEPSIGNFQLVYLQKDKNITAKLEKDYSLLINGVAANISDVNFSGKDGKILLIDNDGNDTWDIVSITEYEYMLVDSKNLINSIFADSASDKVIKLEDGFVKYDVFYVGADRRRITPDEIEVGMFLRYSISKDSGYVSINVLDNVFSGNLDSVGNERMVINGNEYPYSVKLSSRISTLSIGGVYKFYADEKGKIVFFSSEASDYMFGFVMAAKKNTNRVDKTFNVKIMNNSGEKITYTLADKVVVDGVAKTSEQAESVFFNSANSNTYCQLIRYKTDSNGKLKLIDTCDDSKSSDFSEQTDYDNMLIRNYKGASITLGSTNPYVINKEFVADANDEIFVVPAEASGVAGMAPCDDEFFEVIKVSDIIYNMALSLNSNKYKYDVYNINEAGNADAIVLYRNYGEMYAINEQTNYALVTDVIDLYNQNTGDVEKEVSYFCNGEFGKAVLDKNVQMTVPEKGDIIRFVLVNEKIKNLNVVFDGTNYTDSQSLNERWSLKRLRHKNFTGGILRADVISTSGTETPDRFFDLRYTKFVEFNTRTKESFAVSTDVVMANGVDYAEYKDIFVVVFNYAHQICILYK